MILVNLHSARKYLTYKLFSRHKKGFGIHSPFIFDVVTRVLRNKIDPAIVCKIEKIRKRMLSDKRQVNVTDYGAGGNRNSTRTFTEIAGKSSLPEKYGRVVAALAGEYGRDTIVELGTSLGISTLYLSFGSPSSTIHTAEGCPELSRYASENFLTAERDNIVVYNKTFDDFISYIEEVNLKPGMVFIDGDHRPEALLRYFRKIEKLCRRDGVIVIDDIHSDAGMSEAWEEIKKSESVNVTIDIYRMGIVFLRSNISEKHYIIRY